MDTWLFAMAGCVALSAIVATWSATVRRGRVHYVAKPLTTLLILATALLIPDAVSPIYRLLVLVGLAASLAGDVLLMLPPDRYFVAGLGAFALAHISYILAFAWARAGAPISWPLPVLLALYGAIVLAALWRHLGNNRIPVIVYMILIELMAWQALEYWLLERSLGSGLAALGALLFVASDTVLAFEKFRGGVPYADILVLGPYYAAQFLIALSVGSRLAP